jgi:hypothetical protein
MTGDKTMMWTGYYVRMMLPRVCYPLYIRYKYRKEVGRNCNLKHPSTYTEKIQWAKFYRRHELLSELTDKIAVRKWVAQRIGEDYLIPTIGNVYKNANEIEFENLPDRYVLKCNNGSGFNIIVNDNNSIDIGNIKQKLNKWINTNFAYYTLEMQYEKIKPQIYIEENLLKDDMVDLPDYKFFCFDGKVFCSYVMKNTFPVHHDAELGIFDRDFILMPYTRADFKPIKTQIEKPENYEKMVGLAEKLAEGFSHVRVDLYNVKGKIYFGEMTFSTESGFFKHEPEDFDRILGEQWDLSAGI